MAIEAATSFLPHLADSRAGHFAQAELDPVFYFCDDLGAGACCPLQDIGGRERVAEDVHAGQNLYVFVQDACAQKIKKTNDSALQLRGPGVEQDVVPAPYHEFVDDIAAFIYDQVQF